MIRGAEDATPAEMLAATYGLREARIRLLAAGAAIIETGIREGAIITAGRARDGWRDRLDELAHGWIP